MIVESKRLLLLSGVQQTLAMFAGLCMVPLIVTRALPGVSVEDSANMVVMAILCCAISTFLQAVRWGWIGCGYLLCMGSSSLFIAPSIAAGHAGGLPLLFGMTLAMAPVELILAPLARYLRKVISPSVIGVMIMLLACSVLPVSMKQFGGGYGPDFGHWKHILVGFVTIAAVLGAHLFGGKVLRTGSMVFGVLVGYALAACLGQVSLTQVQAASWLAVPKLAWYGHLSFDASFILPFALAYVLTTLETYGDIHAIAHVSGDDIQKLDGRRITGGLMVDGLGSMLGGALGTIANTSFSGNIAIAEMTRMTSRKIGYVVCCVLLVLSVLPKLAMLIVTMPAGVLGGSMLVAAAFLINVAVRILRKEVKDDSEVLVVGLGLMAGLGVQMMPEIGSQAVAWLKPLVGSSVCMGTLTAVACDGFRRLALKVKHE